MIVWNYVWDVFIKDKYEVFECSSFGKAVVYVVHSVRLLRGDLCKSGPGHFASE